MIECELWAFLILTFTFTTLTCWCVLCPESGWECGDWCGLITPDLQTHRPKPDRDLFTSQTWPENAPLMKKKWIDVFCARESKVQLLHWEVQKARSSFCLIVARLCNAGAESRCIQVIVWYSAVQCSTVLVIVSREGWGNIDPDPAVMHCTRCTALQRSRLPY